MGVRHNYSMLSLTPVVKRDNPEIAVIPKRRVRKMGGALTMSQVKPKPAIKVLNENRIVSAVRMQDIKSKGILQQYIDGLYGDDGKLRTSKQLYQYIPSGAWKDRRCFIIGGGTSAKGFDFSKLKGELVITVNRAFEYCPNSAINLCQDARVFGFYENKEFPEGAEAKKKFEEYAGYKTWLNVQAFPFPEDIYQIDIVHSSDFKYDSYSGGIPPYNNSGINALCLAVCLGANPIYLIGFDCYGVNGRTANFHSGYPESNEEHIYNDFIRDFNYVSHLIKDKTKVINLNPDSAIKCFDFGRFEDIKKIKRPIVVSFYTEGTGYELEIRRLKKSAVRFGLEYDFYAQKDLGSWRANIHDRIRILRHFLDKHKGRDILYIDADGEIQQYPALFDDFKDEFGITKIDRSKYWKDWEEFHSDRFEYLGGTMYLKNCKPVRELLDLWERLDAPMETKLSQHTLIHAIEGMEGKIKINLLPLTYCQIFDVMINEGEPVIEHFQASRRGLLYVKVKEDGIKYLDFGNGVKTDGIA